MLAEAGIGEHRRHEKPQTRLIGGQLQLTRADADRIAQLALFEIGLFEVDPDVVGVGDGADAEIGDRRIGDDGAGRSEIVIGESGRRRRSWCCDRDLPGRPERGEDSRITALNRGFRRNMDERLRTVPARLVGGIDRIDRQRRLERIENFAPEAGRSEDVALVDGGDDRIGQRR